MGEDRAVHSALVDKVYILACQIVQSVQIHRLFVDDDLFPGLLYIENGLEQDPVAVLDELSHGVQISGQVYGCREDAFLVLALALAVELFPPLRYIVQARLVVCQNLNGLALAQKDISHCRIFHGVVVLECILECSLSSCRRAFHQLVDVRAAHRDRKQAYRRQYGETSAYVIRYNEGLITFLCRQILERALRTVCGCIDSLRSFRFAVFLLQDLLEYAECDRRLCRCAGLGDHVDREIPVADNVHQIFDISAADAVSHIVDLRRFADFLRNHICK